MSISPVSNLQEATLIVDPTPGNGNYTTIQAAINAAVSGNTILIKPGTYSESPVLKAGVNLTAFTGDDEDPSVTISGNITFTTAGFVAISNIRIQSSNLNFALSVTGSADSNLTLNNCTLIAGAASCIEYTSSSANSALYLYFCQGYITGLGGQTMFAMSSAGTFQLSYCTFENPGASTTASTASAGLTQLRYSRIKNAITTSGTAEFRFNTSESDLTAINTTCLILGGSGDHSINRSSVLSGTAVAMQANTGVTSNLSQFRSSNTNTVTGTGHLTLTNLSFGLTNANVTCTINKNYERHGISVSSVQPAFSATKSAPANGVVGDGATVTVLFDNVLYDQDSDFDSSTGIYTAPATGIYSFNATVAFTSTTNAMNDYMIALVSTAATFNNSLTYNAADGPTSNSISINQELSMTVGDTIHVEVTITGGAANNANIAGSGSPYVTFFSGHLMF